MKPPTTYAGWVACLDALRKAENEEAILQALENGRLVWQSGVAERIVQAVNSLLEYRLKRIDQALQRDLQASRGQEGPIIGALTAARSGFTPLVRVANLPALPTEVRAVFTDMILQYGEQAQRSLEASAQQDRSGRLLSLVQKAPLSRLPETTPPVGTPAGNRKRGILS